MNITKKSQKFGVALLTAALLLTSLAGCHSNEPSEWENPLSEPEFSTSEVNVDFNLQEKLKTAVESNSDTVGWLKIPNTTVDNSVVQASNNDYYKRRNELKQPQFTGCFFADYENTFTGTRDGLSKNTIIYGHNIEYTDNPNGQKFSQLFKFTDEEFAKNNPYIYFSTEGEDMVWQIFSVLYCDVDDTAFDYIAVSKMTDSKYQSILNEAKLRSQYIYNDVNVTKDDKILILSTCSYHFGIRSDIRFVIMAKLLPEDAQLESTANLTVNPSPKNPK